MPQLYILISGHIPDYQDKTKQNDRDGCVLVMLKKLNWLFLCPAELSVTLSMTCSILMFILIKLSVYNPL